ncbi:hypothetical protein D3C78_1427550 [compost metagenome]
MGFGGHQSLGVAVVQRRVIERANAAGAVVVLDRLDEFFLRQLQLAGKVLQSIGGGARKDRRHEAADGLLIDDRIRLLTGLSGHQTPPDRITFWPEILTFVVEAFAITIDHHTQRYAVDSGADAAVVEWRAGINRDHVCLRRIADHIGAKVEHAP